MLDMRVIVRVFDRCKLFLPFAHLLLHQDVVVRVPQVDFSHQRYCYLLDLLCALDLPLATLLERVQAIISPVGYQNGVLGAGG